MVRATSWCIKAVDCVFPQQGEEGALWDLFYQGTNLLHEGSIFMIQSLFKSLISQHPHIYGYILAYESEENPTFSVQGQVNLTLQTGRKSANQSQVKSNLEGFHYNFMKHIFCNLIYCFRRHHSLWITHNFEKNKLITMAQAGILPFSGSRISVSFSKCLTVLAAHSHKGQPAVAVLGEINPPGFQETYLYFGKSHVLQTHTNKIFKS